MPLSPLLILLFLALVAYGQQTSGAFGESLFTDSRDGKEYRKVVIGKQSWMAENLNYNASDSKCYSNQEINCQKYGRLYNWSTAQTACPKGWHLPSNAEWEVLAVSVGGENTEGKYLKAKSGWNDYKGKSGNGEDKYGFSALPGGYGGSGGSFSTVGNFGVWWSSSEDSSRNAYYRRMNYNDESVIHYFSVKSNLYSVRCLYD